MSDPTNLNAGILLSAAVSGVVSISALTLTIFLIKRWRQLGATMKAYACFWGTTVLVWLSISLRYFVLSVDRASPLAHLLDISLQTFVFLSGPPLFAYIMMRVSGRPRITQAVTFVSAVFVVIAVWFVASPGGLSVPDFTFFSAETTPNNVSLSIFNSLSAIIFLLLIFDLGRKLRQYRHSISRPIYDALYPVPIIVYIVLGSIEQSGLVGDWLLVVFRVLYTAAFLSVYILMSQHEAATETIFLDQTMLQAQ